MRGTKLSWRRQPRIHCTAKSPARRIIPPIAEPIEKRLMLSSTLTGTVIGTPGSYQNDGNTITKAFDGNLSTYYDGATANGNYAGLDFGAGEIVTQISYAPRAEYADRMVGGIFQGSNSADFSNSVALYTITSAPAQGKLTTVNSANSSPYEYVRYLSPSNSYGNVAEINFTGNAPASSPPATGTVIGTPGSYANEGNTIANAFDGNLSTFFDGPTANGNYVGMDFGTSQVITQISYAPRVNYAYRMVGGVFQGSNSADFSNPVTLYTITSAPAQGKLTTVNSADSSPFEYVRYLSPSGSYGNIAELSFGGNAPTSSVVLASDGTLTVTGNATANNITVFLDGVVPAVHMPSTPPEVLVTLNGNKSAFDATQVSGIVVNGGSGNDTIAIGGGGFATSELDSIYNTYTVAVNGGAGDDQLSFDTDVNDPNSGAVASVAINGGDGNDNLEYTGMSPATLNGGAGNDTLTPGVAGSGDTTLIGGPGTDVVDYSARTDNLVVYLDGSKPSGDATNPTDTFDGTVENVQGGSGNDLIVGTSATNALYGNGGNDTLISNGGNDSLYGGDGDDNFQAADGSPTYIDGGAGTDTAYVDPSGDTTVNVENVATSIPTLPSLTGTVVGTAGSYNNDGNTIANAFDNNLSTYVDAPTANGNYAGLDFGTSEIVTQISYAPRANFASRMVGGIFQGANSADFSNPVTLYTITSAPVQGTLTTVNSADGSPFEYARYLSPNNSFGNVAEISFAGHAPASGAVVGTDGTLTVTGTANADTIDVSNEGASGITVAMNGSKQQFGGPATAIVVNALDGDDTITVENADYGITGDAVPALVNAGAGDDRVTYYGDGAATLNGGDGNDYLGVSSEYAELDVTMNGGNGNDTLDAFSSGPAGAVIADMFGDAGNDTFSADDPNCSANVSGGDGTDTVIFDPSNATPGPIIVNLDGQYGENSNFFINSDVENITTLNSDRSLDVIGNDSNNVIKVASNGAAVTIMGMGGDDTLDASASTGPVTLDGGDGNDTLIGGTGSNHFSGGAGTDLVDYSARTDNLAVYLDGSKLSGDAANPTDTFDGTVENVYGGFGNDLIVGTRATNTLYGGGGNNTLISNGGNDSLYGADGDDTFQADDNSPTYIDGGAGTNTADLDYSGDTTVNVQNLNYGSSTYRLAGTVIGTAGSYRNDGNTIANAFDGNPSTFFDGPTANGNYAGLDLGFTNVITQIRYVARAGFTNRMVGGIFQGSNNADFSDALNLFTITSAPQDGTFTTAFISNPTAFRYMRYLSPDNSFGDIAELQFYGHA